MKLRSPYKYLPAHIAEALRQLGITVRRPVQGAREGQHRSPHFGSSVEFAEYRQYTPGDPPSLIDWSVFARSDRYVVRRFFEETNLRAYVLLDTSESLAYQDGGAISKMEYASFLAAGVMYILISQGDSAGLVTFDDHIRDLAEPVGTSEGLRPMLQSLERIKPSGRSDIEASIHELAGRIRPKSLVVVISDLLQDPAKVIRGMRHLHHDGHNLMVLHVLDAGERRLSFGGIAELRELETGKRLVVEVDEIKEAYAAAVERYLNELRLGCTECMADYHAFDTRTAIEEALTLIAHRPA